MVGTINREGRKKAIGDEELTRWFKNNYNSIKFLNFRVHHRVPSQIKIIKKDIENLNPKIPLYRQKEILLKIWVNLIGSAIVFLKSRDKREGYHDDEDYGVGKLFEFFKSFSNFERLFYGADEYYRDHVSHMFKVFLLGEYLLVKNNLFEEIKIGKNLLDSNFQITNQEKEAMWCIISLTHDLGYGMGKIPNINNKTRQMLEKFDIFNVQELGFSFPKQPFNEFVITFISSNIHEVPNPNVRQTETKPEDRRKYVNHTQSKYFLKFSNSFENFGHGIFSCILLMKNLIYFLESDYSLDLLKPLNQLDARNYLIRQTILRSIASHDCRAIYYLKVPDFPFLLTIFDEMQDWGRPGLSDLFQNKPDKKFYIEKMDSSDVSYKIVYRNIKKMPLEEKEKEKIPDYVKDEFIDKCRNFLKILRSAVDVKEGERQFTLTFTIQDRVSRKAIQKAYTFIHENPKDVRVKINEEVFSWNEFIEQEESRKQKRDTFIHDYITPLFDM